MFKTLSALAFALCIPLAGSAYALDAPTGEVVLRVTGNVSNVNDGKAAAFDISMLEHLSGRKANMETPWTQGDTVFEGPLLKAVLDAAGASGKTLKVKAINDYSAEVPASDATDYATMLATKMNGKDMSVREKGPLFLIYPFDTNKELYNEKYFSRSVWQIMEIEVIN